MIPTYEFRLGFLIANIMFWVAYSHGQPATGIWFAAFILVVNYGLQCLFGRTYVFDDALPLNLTQGESTLDFWEQFSRFQNLSTHPLTILTGLPVLCFSGYIWGQVTASVWSAIGYAWLTLLLVAAVPANLWGFILFLCLETKEETMNQFSSPTDGYEGQ